MVFKRIILFTFSITLAILVSACQSTTSETIKKKRVLITINDEWLNDSYASYLKNDLVLQHIVKTVTTMADSALNQGPYSVLDKAIIPPSGDKQDYMSIGPYWWPDETKPGGLPWIKRDGKVNPSSKTGGSDKAVMNNMLFQISDLALAYHYTKEEKYAKHAALLMNTWFLDEATQMKPALTYGQAVPGKSDGRKYGIIETRWFIRLLDDVALISASPYFSDVQQVQFKTWVSNYLNWLLSDDLGIGACDAHNNHGTYCEAQVAAYALFVGNESVAKEYANRVFNTRLMQQVEPSGAQPDELARTRPLHYSVFNLEAYFYAARVGDHLGLDLWHYRAENGVSLQTAIDFLLPAIKKEGYWENIKDKKMRRGRLYYFLQYAHQKYGDEKYRQAMNDLLPLVALEDRSEMLQCFLIMPKPKNMTLAQVMVMDPKGKKSKYRCYY